MLCCRWVHGYNLPSVCPTSISLLQERTYGQLELDTDFSVSHCSRTSLLLTLLPGKVWGSVESVLKLTQVGTGVGNVMDVVVASVIRALAPTLAFSTQELANSGTHIEIWGRNLRPADAQKTDVYVRFTNASEAGRLSQTASNPQGSHEELPVFFGNSNRGTQPSTLTGNRGTRPGTLAGGWLRLGHLDYTEVEETSEYTIAVERLGLDYTANAPRWTERQEVPVLSPSGLAADWGVSGTPG